MAEKKSKPENTPTKFEVVYEDEYSISIWKYDLNRFSNGPVEVEQKYKKEFFANDTKKKTLGDLANESKKVTKSKRTKS